MTEGNIFTGGVPCFSKKEDVENTIVNDVSDEGWLIANGSGIEQTELQWMKVVWPSLKNVAACFEALFSMIFNPGTVDPATANSVMAEQVSCNPAGNDSWIIVLIMFVVLLCFHVSGDNTHTTIMYDYA